MRNLISFLLSGILGCIGNISATNIPYPDIIPTDSIVVSGVITSIPENGSKTIIINECDPSEKAERRLAEPDSAGHFREKIPFSFGHTFTVNYHGNFINAYAEPGDSVFIQIDASKSPLEFHLSGNHESLNEQYSHAYQALSKIYWDVALPADTIPLADYMIAFKKEVARTRTLVDEYIASNAINSDAAKLLHIDNIFSIANLAIGFQGIDKEEQLAFFTDSIFDIFNEDNTKLMIFPYHIKALLSNFPEYVGKVPKGLIRDLMYASLQEQEEEGFTVERSEFANPAYYDRLYADRNITFNLDAIKQDDFIVAQGDTIYNIKADNPIKWLVKEFPEKLIHLDISATWCGPCRAALAGSEGLREHFKNSDVIFAVIWLKSDLQAWTKLTPSIDNAIHIFIPDDDTANRIMGTMEVKGLPSYFLIDRKGNIGNKDLPKLNSNALPDFLKSKL